jgi:hypothetical protein
VAVFYRNIIGTVKDSQGAAIPTGSLWVRALEPVVDGDDLVYPEAQTATITDGLFTLTLVAPCTYDFKIKDEGEDTVWNFQAPLQNDATIPISLATLFTNREDALINSDAVTENPTQTWVPDGVEGEIVPLDGSEFWYGAGRKCRLDYAVQGTTPVARYVDLGLSDQIRLWPCGLDASSAIILDASGVFELSAMFYVSASGAIINFGSDLMSGTSSFGVGIYNADLYIESICLGQPDLAEDYQYESIAHGLTLPGWMYLKAQFDFANGTFKASCGNTEPATWNLTAQMSQPGVVHIKTCPFLLLQGNAKAIDIASFRWEQVG